MLKEYMKFTKKKPLTGAVIGLSIVYGANKIRKAFTAEEGEFWDLGATTSTSTTTSSSHPMNRAPAGDMMKHPTALFGHKNMGHCNCAVPTCPSCANMGLAGGMSTTTSTSSAHAHKRTSNYGEDVYKSPLTLMGVPSSIKRRVGNAEDTESYRPTNPVVPEAETVESALGWI